MKISDGEILIRTQPKTLFTLLCELSLDFKDIFKSILDPADSNMKERLRLGRFNPIMP